MGTAGRHGRDIEKLQLAREARVPVVLIGVGGTLRVLPSSSGARTQQGGQPSCGGTKTIFPGNFLVEKSS